jgi:molybdenum cofactor guanylyltransferase
MQTSHPKFSAAILAGGKNSRMNGENKALLKLGNSTILEMQLKVLSELFDDIIIVGKGIDENIGYRIVEDIIPEKGPLSGIHAALSYSKSDFVFVVSCDMPFLSSDFIKILLREASEYQHDAVVPIRKNGIEPLHAVYRKTVIKNAEKVFLQKDIRIRNMFNDIKIKYFDVNLHNNTEMIFFNINCPEDFEQAQHYAKGIK